MIAVRHSSFHALVLCGVVYHANAIPVTGPPSHAVASRSLLNNDSLQDGISASSQGLAPYPKIRAPTPHHYYSIQKRSAADAVQLKEQLKQEMAEREDLKRANAKARTELIQLNKQTTQVANSSGRLELPKGTTPAMLLKKFEKIRMLTGEIAQREPKLETVRDSIDSLNKSIEEVELN